MISPRIAWPGLSTYFMASLKVIRIMTAIVNYTPNVAEDGHRGRHPHRPSGSQGAKQDWMGLLAIIHLLSSIAQQPASTLDRKIDLLYSQQH